MNLLGTKALRWVAVGALITLAGAAAAFSLRTQTIEASGARSAGGPYTLTSAVGQPIVNLSNPSTGGTTRFGVASSPQRYLPLPRPARPPAGCFSKAGQPHRFRQPTSTERGRPFRAAPFSLSRS